MAMIASENLAQELNLIEDSVSLSQPEGRRIAVRSVFAAVEILVAEISVNLVDKVPPSDGASHEERHRWFLELCALSNISHRINDKGQVQLEKPNTPLRNRALFALNMCARATGTNLSPRSEEGWSDFLHATKIRNRITHPKNQDDLDVTSRDYDTVVKGFQWFVRCHHRATGVDKLTAIDGFDRHK